LLDTKRHPARDGFANAAADAVETGVRHALEFTELFNYVDAGLVCK
jgi:hypothetical protein